MPRIHKVLCLTVATLAIAAGCANTSTNSHARGLAPVRTASASNSWQNDYSTSSNESSPSASQDTSNLQPATNATRIALLLPESGKLKESADAVREGFMAAAGNSRNSSTIRVYDTEGDTNVVSALQHALDNGADFIVGPLTKPGVAQIQNTHFIEAPILALNYTDAGSSRSDFYQFGLAPEDEARQAAIQAWKLGKHNAMVLAQNNTWGTRVANAFSRQWIAQGGTILKSAHLQKNLAKTVSQLLEVNVSQDRANNVKRLVNGNVNFEPRRRQDVDVIFLAAYPVEARQIKPLLAFYYAGDVPVYASASVFAGARNPKADRDLDGVTFCDSPAILTNTNLPPNMSPEEAGNKARLYALGVDAYNLIPQLNNLERYRDVHFNGASGQLFLENGQIVRQLPCAKFKNGIPVVLNG